MSRADSCDVIVIGAGVVGSAAALALAATGLQVAIVEAQAPTPWQPEPPDLRVYAFAPDAQAMLQSLGVWDAVAAARVQPYRRMRVWDAAAGDELDFDADAFGRENLGHIVEHSLLVDRLWAALARQPGIQRHCPARLVALEQDENQVSVALDDGRRLRARLLLGADGAGSRVRELAGLAAAAHDYRQRALVAYVRTAQPHQDTCWQRFLPTGPLAFLPCSDGRSSIVWTLPEAEAQRLLALDDAAFCAELTRAFDARLGAVTEVSARQAFPLRRVLATQMLQGRITVVGDAAHVVHPLAGQGVNLGLRDVAALAALAARAQAQGRDFSAEHRLQRWARSRLSEDALAAYSFEAINALFSNQSLLPTLARGHLLGLAGRIPPLAHLLWRRAAGL
jgi:2-octaprenyl-3-methyl-6-methoxy-1,4-benzoquinol hydroxylase